MIDHIVSSFKTLQDNICAGLEEFDGSGKFQEDIWERPEGGGGRTRIIKNGDLIVKGGVNFSHVHGEMPEKISSKLKLKAGKFHATGVSIVIHAHSPHVPTIHMNVRYFEMEDGTWWFGGGVDVTPVYLNVEAAISFHLQLKRLCDRFNPDYYPKYKAWCDDYFYLKHRNESRGIGGLFFDRCTGENESDKQHWLDFALAVGNEFVPCFKTVGAPGRDLPYGEREKEFQLLRRSRYVEFNLVYDKGTKFGLDTGGRTESILMSMPPLAQWEYMYEPNPGSPEEFTMKNLKAIDWLDEKVQQELLAELSAG